MSDQEFEKRVRERAFELWTQEGQPEGKAEEHWDKAKSELASQTKHDFVPSNGANSNEPGTNG